MKKVKSIVKIQIAAGKATPAPPVGPSLAPHGINISEFCQRFNAATQEMSGFTIPAKVVVYEDRSYDFTVSQPPASELLLKEAGLEKGSGKPQTKKIGSITRDQLKKVAEKKISDLNTDDIEVAMTIIEGTAKNMGLDIK